MRARLVFVSVATYIASVAAFAADDFVTMKAVVDAERKAKSETETILECTKNSTCKGIIDAVFAYFGIDSTEATTMAAQISTKSNGENTEYTFTLPKGYQYCRSRIDFNSVIPATGDRASYLTSNATPTGVYVYTWTPRRHTGQGKSHVLAHFTILGVRDDIAEAQRAKGACKAADTHNLVTCRGARGVNKGKPACSGEKKD